MPNSIFAALDSNSAVAEIAYRLNEVIATTAMSSSIAEWATTAETNLWGTVPAVTVMPSKAASPVLTALQAGSLTTTLASSQDSLAMLPDLYQIAGALLPTVMHVAVQLPTPHLSIGGDDRSDVMVARGTGWTFLYADSIQTAQDFAAIATCTSLQSRLPVIHCFNSFSASPSLQPVERLSDETLRSLIPDHSIEAYRVDAQMVDRPLHIQLSVNSHYRAFPAIVQSVMDQFARLAGRQYRLYDYYGHPAAERVIVLMGSDCATVQATVDELNAHNELVGMLMVRLFRPFDIQQFVSALPGSVRSIAVLDRSQELGSSGEPLYLDVVNALHEAWKQEEMQQWRRWEEVTSRLFIPLSHYPQVVGGYYGCVAGNLTPAMITAVFDNLAIAEPHNHFTVGTYGDLAAAKIDSLSLL
jgi:pyruvate-ferredoxin/flavodoxin oxidoreductase